MKMKMIAEINFDLTSNGESISPLNKTITTEYIGIFGDLMCIYKDEDMSEEKSDWLYESLNNIYRNINLENKFCKILKYGCYMCKELIHETEYTNCCNVHICNTCENKSYYFLKQFECPICNVILF
jgi:hypothetical protein